MFLCVAIATSVSPSCTSTEASKVSWSLFNLQDIVLARAVTDAVRSQAFIIYHLIISYATTICGDIVMGDVKITMQ